MYLKHTSFGGGKRGAIQPLAGNITEDLETKISVKVVCQGRGRGRGGGGEGERKGEGEGTIKGSCCSQFWESTVPSLSLIPRHSAAWCTPHVSMIQPQGKEAGVFIYQPYQSLGVGCSWGSLIPHTPFCHVWSGFRKAPGKETDTGRWKLPEIITRANIYGNGEAP